MELRRAILEMLFVIDNPDVASSHASTLLAASNQFMFCNEVQQRLTELERFVEANHDKPEVFLEMEFESALDFDMMDVYLMDVYLSGKDDSCFDVVIPVIPIPPKAIYHTTDHIKHDVEYALSQFLLDALKSTDDRNLQQFFLEVAMVHPYFLEVTRRVTTIIDAMWAKHGLYALESKEEVISYFFITAFPLLQKMLATRG